MSVGTQRRLTALGFVECWASWFFIRVYIWQEVPLWELGVEYG